MKMMMGGGIYESPLVTSYYLRPGKIVCASITDMEEEDDLFSEEFN